jgi:hypothetical protein
MRAAARAWEGIAASARSTTQAAARTARGRQLGAIDLADALLARRQAHEAPAWKWRRAAGDPRRGQAGDRSHVIWADEDTDEHPQ